MSELAVCCTNLSRRQDQRGIVSIKEFDPVMLVCVTGWKQIRVCAELFTDICHFFNLFLVRFDFISHIAVVYFSSTCFRRVS